MDDPSLLLTLANYLPKNAMGFEAESGSGKLTAEEFLTAVRAPAAGKTWSYLGNLREHLSFEAAIDLLRQAVDRKPGFWRKERLSLTCGPFVWKGAPVASEGWLQIWRGKRLKDISLVGTASCEAGSKKDRAVAELFSAIARQTPFDFAKGKVEVFKDFRPFPVLGPRERLIAEISYHAALDAAAAELESMGIEFGPAVGLAGDLDALLQRIERKMAGESERVDFPRIVKKMVRENFPLLVLDHDDTSGCVSFRKTLTQSLELLIDVDRINACGLGKAFTLSVGADITSGPFAGLRWKRNAFESLGGAFSLCWAYGTAEECSIALDQLQRVLNWILPVLERQFRRYLDPIPSEIPSELERRPALSAKGAFGIAKKFADAWSGEPKLIMLMSGGVVSPSVVPHVGRDGRLSEAGFWTVGFLSDSTSQVLHITIPVVGAIRKAINPNIGEHLAIQSTWMDSDKAVALAHELALKEKLNLTEWAMSLSLGGLGRGFGTGNGYFVPRWQLRFKAPTERGQQRLIIQFEPENGGEAEIISG